MNSRLQELVDKGYSRDKVLELALFTDEELDYAVECAFKRITLNCERDANPKVIYIGGQPGCGKTVMSMQMKKYMPNFVEISMDNYRMYHPRYLEIEKYIREMWEGKTETVNDTPGNDIANFTHLFAGVMTDKLYEKCSSLDEYGRGYSILYEWGMREPNGPLKTMEDLKNKGYSNIVLFVGTSSSASYEACNLRSDVMKNSKRIFRKVPKYFHDLCINSLPSSVDTIYNVGTEKQIIDYMGILSREGKIVWNLDNKEKPGVVYSKMLSGYSLNEQNDLYKAILANKKEMEGLSSNKDKLIELRETFVYLSPYLFSNDTKKRN